MAPFIPPWLRRGYAAGNSDPFAAIMARMGRRLARRRLAVTPSKVYRKARAAPRRLQGPFSGPQSRLRMPQSSIYSAARARGVAPGIWRPYPRQLPKCDSRGAVSFRYDAHQDHQEIMARASPFNRSLFSRHNRVCECFNFLPRGARPIGGLGMSAQILKPPRIRVCRLSGLSRLLLAMISSIPPR